ncbi:hypothetical protein MB46_17945 [Arthrobacter alpinus]|uniref:hypothetical protein n=1 Tax=Arthrobacter alpinus TaxID=656366 RepID=UPI0005C96E3A|nr:hypothetical protein [Arthrobacter alpinus]ALV47087.1 hypothetical protein MB46_17945 [Arthrobacter alpinus]
MKAFIASILAAIFGIFTIHVPGFYIAAIVISIALSLLTAVLCFVSAKSNRSQAASASPVYAVAGILALLTAVAGSFRLSDLTNMVPVSAGFDLLGWLAAAALTIGLSGSALLASGSKQRGANN